MMNPIEFLPSAFLCLHKLSLNIVSQINRVENKKKTWFLQEYTSASVTLGNSLFLPWRAGNYYDNVPVEYYYVILTLHDQIDLFKDQVEFQCHFVQ